MRPLYPLAAITVLSTASAQEIVDTATMRSGARACPFGRVVTGADISSGRLLCSFVFTHPGGSFVRNESSPAGAVEQAHLFKNWTTASYGSAPNGWYVGDFNGDGKDDIFRYCPENKPCPGVTSGADVFLSTGTEFQRNGSWIDAGYGFAPNGWYVGDFNGDGKDDIFRYCPDDLPCGLVTSGAEVFLSTGNGFQSAGSWTGYGYGFAPNGWYVGNFNGKDTDGKERDDIFRYCPDHQPCANVRSGADVFISTGLNSSGLAVGLVRVIVRPPTAGTWAISTGMVGTISSGIVRITCRVEA